MANNPAEWIWYGHAGHFICSRWCRYHLCTNVGNYLVSTVGEYWPERGVREIHAQIHDPNWLAANRMRKGDEFDNAYFKRFGFEKLGASSHCYETMVFALTTGQCDDPKCGCGLPNVDYGELDGQHSMTAGEASQFHMKMCEKWAKADEHDTSVVKSKAGQEIKTK